MWCEPTLSNKVCCVDVNNIQRTTEEFVNMMAGLALRYCECLVPALTWIQLIIEN